jgi:hypothetical protein
LEAFPDYSAMRSEREGKPIVIPLNGQRYHAIPDPPADLVLEAITGVDIDPALAARFETEPESVGTADRIKVASAGREGRRRMVAFLDAVLEPDSAARWAFYLGRLPDDATPQQRADHAKHRITMPQVQAVYQQLQRIYSGGTPTEAPSSSNGHGATGSTSTAGAPSEA